MRWRVRRFLREWRTFLLIMVAGLLTGFLTWAAMLPVHPCHQHCATVADYKGIPAGQYGP
jgi:hypothetical protein